MDHVVTTILNLDVWKMVNALNIFQKNSVITRYKVKMVTQLTVEEMMVEKFKSVDMNLITDGLYRLILILAKNTMLI